MAPLRHRFYPEEHYATLFNSRTGFYARIEETGYPEPFWSRHGPELLDISITNWCDKQCYTCYRSANRNGKHMSPVDYGMILRQAAKMDVSQVALGGGNPNQHPAFVEILKITREEFGIVPNYTTNGRGLTDEVLNATARFCGAVAVSAYEPYNDLEKALSSLRSYGVKTNVHFVLDSQTINTAREWILNPPTYLRDVNAVIFLNYKPIGRGGHHERLLSKSEGYEKFFKDALSHSHPFKIGFDSCMVTGFVALNLAAEVWYDTCEAARFTMYVSETLHAYPCSFMETAMEGVPLTEDNMLHVWQKSHLFRAVRNKLKYPDCRHCNFLALCRGGCPVFSEINLCGSRYIGTAKERQNIRYSAKKSPATPHQSPPKP